MHIIKGLLFVFSHPKNRGKLIETIVRLIWWKCNQLWWQFPAVVSIAPGIQCLCYPSSSFGSLIVYTIWPEFNEMKHVYETLESNDIFIDVGAGLGDFSLIAASKITKGHIFAFEPNQKAADQFKQNIALNHIEKRITLSTEAIADKDGWVYFNANQTTELSQIVNSKGNHALRVKSTTLDSFCKKNKVSQISLLKIDVEGAELRVLRGCQNLLKKGLIKKILLEVNPKSENLGNQTNETLAFLKQFGFSFYSFGENGKKQLFSMTNVTETQNILASLRSSKK